MPLPARHSLAIVGAGPIGLEAAVCALEMGFDVHVFERGEVAAHAHAWGHVTLFTPWRMNLGPRSAARLEAAGWQRPEPEALPTGAEMAERYLEPLAGLPELAPRVHTHAQVVHVGRQGTLPGDSLEARREQPFRLLVRDAGGRENFLQAFAVIDASGVYGQPNWAGDGGIPARQELYLAPQMSYHLDDVLGARRARHAGRRTLVVGAGASAATTVAALAKLADAVPETSVVWVTRAPGAALYPAIANDPVPARAALREGARALARGEHPAVTLVDGARVDGFGFNSATHRYRVSLMAGEQPRLEEVDQVIVNTGYHADDSLWSELRVETDPVTGGALGVAKALAGTTDCAGAPRIPAESFLHPEPGFAVLGHKAYGRSSSFLLADGYAQVEEVLAAMALSRVPARV